MYTLSLSVCPMCLRMSLALSRQYVQVKKPLNAFMLYMKEMRHKVLQEGRERESAAINRILGRRVRTFSFHLYLQKSNNDNLPKMQTI